MATHLSSDLTTNALMQHKMLPPLDEKAESILERIQSLDVTRFSEADVREEIISPLLMVLGYDKQSYFSIEREKTIQLLGRKQYLDYNLTLWSENFWLIEAKKPKGKGLRFGVVDIRQAIGYAVHPEISAALVVLCDGRKIAVFDREEHLSTPELTVEITNIKAEINELRRILSPWQVWFYEKRRIVRHLDKVFNKEFNLSRVEEFKQLISQRLDSKTLIVTDNMRSLLSLSEDNDETDRILRDSEPLELIEGAFFLQFSKRDLTTLAESLVLHCREDAFQVLSRVFPDHPRDMNDNYCVHSLNLLIHLDRENISVNWLPSWLANGNDLDDAVRKYVSSCLNHFSMDAIRRNILLYASGVRRLIKLLTVVDQRIWRLGEVQHVFG